MQLLPAQIQLVLILQNQIKVNHMSGIKTVFGAKKMYLRERETYLTRNDNGIVFIDIMPQPYFNN